MPWKWFGVKTVLRTEAQGVPTSQDSSYDSEATLVEERVLLVRARSFAEAIVKAESEVKEYASGQYSNHYGQVIKQRYLGACDVFELYEDPASQVEVFSTTELVPQSISDDDIVNQHFGAKKSSDEMQKRRKFFNIELAPFYEGDS